MSTNVSSVTSHFPDLENGFTTTTSGAVSSGATTVGLNSTAGYTNGEPVVFVIDPTDATKKQTFTGIMDTGGSQVTGVKWTAGTNQTHSAGATICDVPTATHIAMMSKGIKVEHAQDGTHTDITADSITNAGALTQTGASTFTGAMTIKSYDGWITPTYTPVYVSATSIKVTGSDVTTQFPVGTKISLNQSGTKYFYVTSTSFSTDTTINVTGGSDYTVANAAISSFKYSYDHTPQGFPKSFNWTPTWTNLTIGNGTQVFKFYMIGGLVFFRGYLTFGSTSSMGTGPYFTFPVTALDTNKGTASGNSEIGIVHFEDNGVGSSGGTLFFASTTTCTLVILNSAGTYIGHSTVTSTAPHSWNTGDEFRLQGFYEAA